jgi:hypothetical protein
VPVLEIVWRAGTCGGDVVALRYRFWVGADIHTLIVYRDWNLEGGGEARPFCQV